MNNDDYIKKEDLVIGAEYICHARNFICGTWDGENFQYIRNKFGKFYQDTEQHYDDGAPFGTVKPRVRLTGFLRHLALDDLIEEENE